ncbi:MAG: Macrolide export ATP-binding/permease protein MacB [Planctomycetes bacterium]|nr:Macrolide export ATP-binding/permease protein MacB [Planctomycetota bacterium]
MSLWQTLSAALRALLSNKLRTALTMLGIVIGVAAVVTMLSLGEGARESIEGRISSMGANNLSVRPGQRRQGPVRSGAVQTLENEDAEALRVISGVVRVAPMATGGAQAKYLSANLNTTVIGTTPEYFAINNLELQRGQALSTGHIDGRRRVAVLGSEVALQLFGNLDPVGKRIQLKGLGFEVIGVLAAVGSSFVSPDDQTFIPISTHQATVFGQDYLTGIAVEVEGEDWVEPVQADIERILRQRHRLLPGDESDFNVMSTKEMLETVSEVTTTFTAFLAAVAAVSLLVGGIGIMNIMLVSVRERTREIGVRMAVGARRRDVLLQFLIEAVVVSMIGGVAGGVFGIVGGVLLAGWAQVEFVLPAYAVVLALAVSFFTGVMFGVWPARHAAGLDPVEALRFE